jgi:hypothetical protein
MLLLAAVAAVPPPGPRVQAQARARGQILAAVRATEVDWRHAARRSERLVRDKVGREFHLRTIDFE